MNAYSRWNLRYLSEITVVSAATIAVALCSFFAGSAEETSPGPQVDFSWINQANGPRPEYVWENREDVFYHDLSFPDENVVNAPEFVAFMMRPWVFNRAMVWHRENGCILAYCVGGDLLLTGEDAVSRWHSDKANRIEEAGEFTRFEKRSTWRRRDCIVLPSFQFHLGQHPTVELTVSEATDDWQFVISIKGRGGAPLISSAWQKGKASLTFDIARALKAHGYDLNYPEFHFVMGVWGKDARSSSSVTFRVRLVGQPALVSCLPVIRTMETAAKSGVPILAAALDGRGQPLDSEKVNFYAMVGGRKIAMKETNGFWKASVRGLGQGDHRVKLVAEGGIKKTATAHLRVTNGKFWAYDSEHHSFARDGTPTGPRSGSYQGTSFFRDAGLPAERLVNGQEEWDSWDRANPPGEHMHYWESLTEGDLDERFAYLARCGFDHLHLAQHWGVWERLDAGGRIAPHGAEQLALFLRVADRYGLSLIQALSHYEYTTQLHNWHGTIPYTRYLDAGFEDDDWYQPGRNNRFEEMFHQYLLDFVSLFKEETALFAMTASGEGDAHNGVRRSHDVFDLVRSHDRNHLFLAEPTHIIRKLPQEYCQGWRQDLFGGRTYAIAEQFLPEFDLGVEFKLYRLGRLFMAEGSWATSNLYAQFHHRVLKEGSWASGSWVGTRRYRTRLRDSLYLGLVHRLPLIMTWDEQICEDEHRLLAEVRNAVDWSLEFMRPRVAVRVDNSSAAGEGRRKLAQYEKAFAELPLAYELILPDAPVPEGTEIVMDARQPFQQPAFQSDGGVLPDALRKLMPLTLSAGYCANYTWSEDRSTLLAYIYNVTNHTELRVPLAGRFHRLPRPADLTIRLQNLPHTKLTYRLYDLCKKCVNRQGSLHGELELDIGRTATDYVVLVTP